MGETTNKEMIVKDKKMIVRFTSTEEVDFAAAVQQVIKNHSLSVHKE